MMRSDLKFLANRFRILVTLFSKPFIVFILSEDDHHRCSFILPGLFNQFKFNQFKSSKPSRFLLPHTCPLFDELIWHVIWPFNQHGFSQPHRFVINRFLILLFTINRSRPAYHLTYRRFALNHSASVCPILLYKRRFIDWPNSPEASVWIIEGMQKNSGRSYYYQSTRSLFYQFCIFSSLYILSPVMPLVKPGSKFKKIQFV